MAEAEAEDDDEVKPVASLLAVDRRRDDVVQVGVAAVVPGGYTGMHSVVSPPYAYAVRHVVVTTPPVLVLVLTLLLRTASLDDVAKTDDVVSGYV